MKKSLATFLPFLKGKEESLEVDDKSQFVTGVVDKREDSDKFTVKKGDIVTHGNVKFEVTSTNPLRLKDTTTGKFIEAKKNILGVSRLIQHLASQFVIKDKEDLLCVLEKSRLRLSPEMNRSINALNNELIQAFAARNSTLSKGMKVITSEDLLDGKDIANPEIKKEVLDVDDASNKVKLKMADGKEIEVDRTKVMNLTPVKFKQVLRQIYGEWTKIYSGKNPNFSSLYGKDSHVDFVLSSFKEYPEKLNILLSKMVYSGVVSKPYQKFKKGDQVRFQTSDQKGIFKGYDRKSSYDSSVVDYAFVSFGRGEDEVRVAVSNLEFDKSKRVSASEELSPSLLSIAKMLYVYVLDNVNPAKSIDQENWKKRLANLVAEFIDNNSLFSGVDYSLIFERFEKYMKPEYPDISEEIKQTLFKLGYNKIGRSPVVSPAPQKEKAVAPQKEKAVVTSKCKSLKSDKELVVVGDSLSVNREFDEVWSIEEDEIEGRVIKFVK